MEAIQNALVLLLDSVQFYIYSRLACAGWTLVITQLFLEHQSFYLNFPLWSFLSSVVP